MGTYSHSRISSYEQCPQKYKFSYIDKVETEILETVETFMGSLVHEALHKLYKDLIYEKMNTLQELQEFYNMEWAKRWDESILIVKKEYSSENYRKRGERMINEYYEHYKPFNQAKTIALETEEYLDLDENHKIHVRIDRLSSPEEGIYEIHDYKTNSNMKTQQEVDEDRQLAVYAMGVKNMYPDAKEVRLIWHFLEFDREMKSQRTTEALEKLRKDVLARISEIESATQFPTKQSPLCDYCEFKPICPLWKHLYALEAKDAEEFKKDDGVKLVEEYVELKVRENEVKQLLDKSQERIRQYAEAFGLRAIYGSTHQVTIWSKDAFKFPGKNDLGRKELIKALKALNLYDRYLDLDSWALEKEFDMLTHIEKQVLMNFARKEKLFRIYLKERHD